MSCLGTKLYEEAKNGDVGQMKSLINRGANVNWVNQKYLDWTPLIVAAFHGKTAAAQVLIEAGADMNKRNIFGQTPLWLAASNGNDVVELLIKARADMNQVDNLAETPIKRAARMGRMEIVKKLMDAGAEIDNTKNSNSWGEADYRLESSSSQIDIATVFKNRLGCELYQEVLNGDIKAMEKLIKRGADINWNDNWGCWNALIKAVHSGKTDVVKHLINAGSDINTSNSAGQTPMYWAACKGNFDIVRILLENDADFNKQTACGETPIHAAASMGHADIVRVLIEAEADMNLECKRGKTALFSAVCWGHVAVIQCLIDAGADTNFRDGDGRSLLQIAQSRGLEDSVTLLQRAGL